MTPLPNARPASEPPDTMRLVYVFYRGTVLLARFKDRTGFINSALKNPTILKGISHWCELHDLKAKLSEPSANEFLEWIDGSSALTWEAKDLLHELLDQFTATKGER